MKNMAIKRKYKIVDKAKFIRFVFILVFLLLITIIFFQKINRVYGSLYEEQYIEVKVERGDTVWDIARKYMPEKYDVRKMIFEIKEVNNMNNANIYPGDLIKIPIK
ncbi:MAG: LysM peptidoglycan-binding domain-containing protein [Tissierellia bacterium]|nr:LysM peptidoglycan-binding domain-containing protein [Tissierellia bacterium]